MNNLLGIVIPCYCEEEILEYTASTLCTNLERLKSSSTIDDYLIFCIDDGSTDNTWQIIKQLHNKNKQIHGIKLSHNVGHQKALFAGIEAAVPLCNNIITIDADMQDSPEAIEQMCVKRNAGAEIVFGVRSNRSCDTWFKKASANMFYSLMEKSGTNTIANHADFRLMSRRACEAMLAYPERNMFIRGIVTTLGFKTDLVYYQRNSRERGSSKYPFWKMVNFAVDGITSFSIRPIRAIFIVGLCFLLITLSISIYVFIALLLGRNFPGWASLMLSLWFIGSLLLISLGIIGEYIGKIYLEVKNRPRYFIEDSTL